MALKALRPPQPQGRAGRTKRAGEAERGRKVRFLPTLSTLPPHALPAYQELEREFLRWTEIRHPNLLPFYGVYVSQTVAPKVFNVRRDSYGYRNTPLHGERTLSRGKIRVDSTSLGFPVARKWTPTRLRQETPTVGQKLSGRFCNGSRGTSLVSFVVV